jgi:hypothetical protein
MVILIVGLISVLVACLGVYGIISPSGLMAFASRWRSRAGFWIASIFRIGFGLILWLAAPSSRFPLALQILASLGIVSGIMIPFIGFARYQSFLLWWSRRSPLFVRVWAAVAIVMGGFILWTVIA